MTQPRHPPRPPMDLANMRRLRSAVPIVIFSLSLLIILLVFHLIRWL